MRTFSQCEQKDVVIVRLLVGILIFYIRRYFPCIASKFRSALLFRFIVEFREVRQKNPTKDFLSKNERQKPEKSRKPISVKNYLRFFCLLIKGIKSPTISRNQKRKQTQETSLWQICPNSGNKTFLRLFWRSFFERKSLVRFFCLTSRNSNS
jgi:glycosyltransferase involved in cell wall biosynthesis